MANKLRGEVEVELGEGEGKRKLVFYFGINEMIALQEELGVKDDDAFLRELSTYARSMRGMRSIVRHMLTSSQPTTTPEDAGNIIMELGQQGALNVIERVFEGIRPILGVDDGQPEGKATAPSPGMTPS